MRLQRMEGLQKGVLCARLCSMQSTCAKGWLSRLLSGGCSGCPAEKDCADARRGVRVGEVAPLAALSIGQCGEVVEVAGGDQDMVNHFADHGLVRGIRVSVHEQALFGGPMLVSIQGSMVALRRQEAQGIRVKVVSTSAES